MDAWDGYPEARKRLMRALAQKSVANVLAIPPDEHAR